MSPEVTQGEFDFGIVGRSMPRERHQHGWVEKVGKKVKKWEGFWYVYESDGQGGEERRRRRKVLGKCAELSKGDAEDALRDLIRDKRPPETGATFGQLAEWYLKTNEGNWSKKWNATSQGMFEKQILPQLGVKVAAEITRSDVQQAINAIAADPKSQSESIVKKCLTHIRAVFALAIDDEVLQKAPVLGRKKIKMPPMRKASERFLEIHECQKLLEVADHRDYLILRLLIVDGLRPSELFALRPNDIEPGQLKIDQTAVPGEKVKDQGKTEGSLGYVPLASELEAELRAYVREENLSPTDFLFPSTTGTAVSHDNYLDRVLKPLGVLAGIDVYQTAKGETTSGLNHQVLRRTFATHFQKHGEVKDTQAVLRHADATTTLRHYQKQIEQSTRDAMESWDRKLVPRKPAGREEGVGEQRRKVN